MYVHQGLGEVYECTGLYRYRPKPYTTKMPDGTGRREQNHAAQSRMAEPRTQAGGVTHHQTLKQLIAVN